MSHRELQNREGPSVGVGSGAQGDQPERRKAQSTKASERLSRFASVQYVRFALLALALASTGIAAYLAWKSIVFREAVGFGWIALVVVALVLYSIAGLLQVRALGSSVNLNGGTGGYPKNELLVDGKIDASLAALVLDSIARPKNYYARIKESAHPLRRALRVETTYTLRIPTLPEAPTGHVYIALPAVKKGRLRDDFAITSEGRPISTLSYAQSLGVVLSSLRVAVATLSSNPKALDAYLQSESDVARAIGRLAQDPKERGSHRTILKDLSRRMGGSVASDLMLGVTGILLSNYVVIMVVPYDSTPGQDQWTEFRTSERRIMEHGLAVEGRASFPQRFVSWWRSLFGVASSAIAYPTDLAYAAKSYHLEIMGPPGTYLARHEVPSWLGESNGSNGYWRLRGRRGQRYLHFYARDRSVGEDLIAWRDKGFNSGSVTVRGWFYERTPGGIAFSSIASIIALVITYCAWSASTEPTSLAGGGDLIAALLLLPPVFAGVFGLGARESVVAGSVAPRVSAVATACLCLAALLQYAVGGTSNALIKQVSENDAWALILAASCAVAIVTTASWLFRSVIHWRIASRGDSVLISDVYESTGKDDGEDR